MATVNVRRLDDDLGMKAENKQYDVGLSFAGEQREYVELVAEALKGRGISVFYDAF